MVKIDMMKPESCEQCDLMYIDTYGDETCPFVTLDCKLTHERHPNCPLIECEEIER